MERKTHKESWKGEESVKERFLLREDKVVPFIDGELFCLCCHMSVSAVCAVWLCPLYGEHELRVDGGVWRWLWLLELRGCVLMTSFGAATVRLCLCCAFVGPGHVLFQQPSAVQLPWFDARVLATRGHLHDHVSRASLHWPLLHSSRTSHSFSHRRVHIGAGAD